MFKKFAVSSSFLLLLAATVLRAAPAEEPDTVYEFPPVIIVGKAIVDEIVIRGNGSTITRVSAQQIKDLNAMDLPSALRRVPGVTISRYNLVGSYGGAEGGAIYIRGQGAERPGAEIQIIVDGAPRFVGVWTHPLMDLQGIDHLERIDIYKSPQPVRWGNMSLGAVNLVSRRMHREGTKTDITVSVGQENTYNMVFNHGGKFRSFDYYFGSSLKGTDGHRPQADGQVRNYWGRVGYEFNDQWDISLIASVSNNWSDDPGPVGKPVPKRARFVTENFSLNLTLANQNERMNGFFKLYMDDGRINWEQWSEDTDNWFNSKTDWLNRGLRLQQNLMITDAMELTLGFDYDSYGGIFVEEHADPANTKWMPEKYFFNTAGYTSIQHAFSVGRGLTLSPSAGVRFNHHTAFDNEVAPEAGISLFGKKWNLYANYTRGFNYAGIYSVWFYNAVWNYRQEAYRDLKPEQVNHYELGLKLKPSASAILDFSIFRDRGRNRIRLIPPPPPPPSFANVDRFEITGFEASVNWSPVKRLSLFSGLTILGKDPETLPQAPDYMLTLGGNLRFMKRFQLSVDMEAVDERYTANPRFTPLSQASKSQLGKTEAYTIANAKLSYYLGKFGGSSQGSHLFLAVENLTGTDYEYRPGYPMPGVTAFVGLTLGY